MKNKIHLIMIILVFTLITLSIFIISCGKKSSNSPAPATSGAVPDTPFYYFCNFSKDGQFLYAGSYGACSDPHIGLYSFNQTTGETTLVAKMSSGYYLRKFVHHPTLDVVYVTMDQTSIYTHSVNPTTGYLTFLEHTPMNVTTDYGKIWDFVVHPNGNFAYAADEYDDIIETYSIDNEGLLTYQTTTNAGDGAINMVFNSTGDYLYVANYEGDSISVYGVDASTGALTLSQTITTGTNSSPSHLAIDPSGDMLVSANYESHSIYVFAINNSNGQLTFDSSLDTAVGPTSINFEPSRGALYIGNYLFNSISLYHYTPSPISVSFVKNINTVLNYPNQIHMTPDRSFLCTSSSGLERIFQVLKISDASGDLTGITQN